MEKRHESRSQASVLQLGPLPAALENRLRERYRLVRAWEQGEQAALQAAAPFDAAVTASRHPCPHAFLDLLRPGGAVVIFGVGFDKIDLDYAQAKGIQVSNTPDVLTDCVADHAIGLLLAAARGIVTGDRFIRDGKWMHGGHVLTTSITGKRLGIVGLGRIGLAIAQRAAGFRLHIRYHNRRPRTDTRLEYSPSLPDLAHWADFLVVATVGGTETRHLVTREVIDALGPDGFLVNIARGSVVDQAALAEALADGRLRGAALDVFEQEPQADAQLAALDRLVMTPHIAAFTREAQEAISSLVLENLRSFLETGSVVTPVEATGVSGGA